MMTSTSTNSVANSMDLNQSTRILLEGLNEGVVILNECQELILANTSGQYICRLLESGTLESGRAENGKRENGKNTLHPKLKHLCDMLVDSRAYDDDVIILHDSIATAKTTFEVRGQWVTLGDNSYLMLTLQDKQAVRRGQALAESMLWELTSREREVWMLRSVGQSRKAIAQTLYVAEDTVKKHLKNIAAKKQAVEAAFEGGGLLQAS